ncbi:hypothetical protein MMC25_003399 [Agyrium rufum]|nr:hypothetical protein [Agyrium rufum]
MSEISSLLLDAHEKPPIDLRRTFKVLQKCTEQAETWQNDVCDLSDFKWTNSFHHSRTLDSQTLQEAFSHMGWDTSDEETCLQSLQVFEHNALPGLHIVAGLLPEETQVQLVNRLLHRDLADERHKTNVHNHYQVLYVLAESLSGSNAAGGVTEKSFFNTPPSTGEVLSPVDSTTHKPLSYSSFLQRKLRWVTLGGQYDWTRKVYPEEQPPAFPKDLELFISTCFPEMKPEAAIVNVYTPGDTLSLHRDVSEECDRGLVSISIGCDAIFMVGLANGEGEETTSVGLRLRSGDAVYMSGPSRYAWHGVPQIIPNTCPGWLCDWPALSCKGSDDSDVERFLPWKGWMQNKRINLNIRQMKA